MSKFNTGIELTRFLAATLVIVSHVYERWGGGAPLIKYYGHIGVDVFFIISGYVIGLSIFSEKKLDLYDFALRRVTRLAPSYWLLTLIAAIGIFCFPEIARYRNTLEFDWLFSSLLFFPSGTSYGLEKPLLGVGWTLNYEFLFYASVFAFFAVLEKKLLPIIGVISFYVICCLTFGSKNLIDIFNPLLFYFVLGVFWSKFERGMSGRNRKIVFIISIPIFIVSLIFSLQFLIPSDYSNRVLNWGMAAFSFIVMMTLVGDFLVIPKVLSKLGAYSYAAYLLQVFFIPVCYFGLKMLGLEDIYAAIFITVSVTWFCSAIYFKKVEKPLTKVCYNAFKD